MVFHQTAAPTGWTKDTTANLNDTALRVVTGAVNSRTNQSAFSTVFGKTATDGHALTIDQMPLHGHPYIHNTSTENQANAGNGGTLVTKTPAQAGSSVVRAAFTGTPSETIGQSIGGTGGGAAHTHAMDIRVNYHDVIIAAKD
jgi:microcystin-dependent protein